jgi:hypothetical protein
MERVSLLDRCGELKRVEVVVSCELPVVSGRWCTSSFDDLLLNQQQQQANFNSQLTTNNWQL